MASQAEIDFITLWQSTYPEVELTEEHRFYSGRRWRFDFCHLGSHTAIEIEGGVWNQGRHTRGAGYQGDMEKYNTAGFLGWVVIRLSPDMITESNLSAIHSLIQMRNENQPAAIELMPASVKPTAKRKRRTPQADL